MASTKYPKLVRAIDDLLSRMVKDQGEDAINMAIAWCLATKESAKADAEKLPPIPEEVKPSEP
jgi:hypothetical protein